jgi:hypothetical protein
MKLNQIRTKTLNAASAAALDAAIIAWVQGLSTTEQESTFLDIDYSEVAGNYSALITYTL